MRRPRRFYAAQGAALGSRWLGMDAPSRTTAADVALLHARLDDLGRRRVQALALPAVASCAVHRHQLEAMRFELAEVEWQLARLDVAR